MLQLNYKLLPNMDLWGHPRVDKPLILNSLNLKFYCFEISLMIPWKSSIRNPNTEINFDNNTGVI